MTGSVALAIAAAGGLGAVSRYLLNRLISGRATSVFPWGTFMINVSGSLLLGFATGLAVARVIPAEWRAIVGTGLLGGYTTFSTASAEAADLVRQRRPGTAIVYAVGMFVTSLAAGGLGLWLASLT